MSGRSGHGTAAGLRLRVDFIACDGRGVCAEALPGLISLDDWGFPVVRDEVVPGRRLAGLQALISVLRPLPAGFRARSSCRSTSRRTGRATWRTS